MFNTCSFNQDYFSIFWGHYNSRGKKGGSQETVLNSFSINKGEKLQFGNTVCSVKLTTSTTF